MIVSRMAPIEETQHTEAAVDDNPPNPPTIVRELPSRACKISQAQLEEAINSGNVNLLNHYAEIHKIPGYDKLYLDNDGQGNGLCVRYRHDIKASPEHPVRVCEYVGEDFQIASTENVSGIPLRHLMYGCEYVKQNGQTVRRAPTKHLMGMAMYLNDSFDTSPTVKMLVAKDKPELWQMCSVKAGDQATM